MPYKDPDMKRAWGKAYYAAHLDKITKQHELYRVSHRKSIAKQKAVRYQAHQDEERARGRAYYTEHREHMNQQQAIYYKAHYDEIAHYQKGWHDDHRTQLREQDAIYYQTHGEKIRERSVLYRRTHPTQCSSLRAKYRALKSDVLIGDQVAIKAIYRQARENKHIRCYLCHRHIPIGGRHVDHILPLSKGGAHTASNLAVACASCNLSKSAKLPEEIGLLI